MKINNINIGKVHKTYQQQKKEKIGERQNIKGDRMNISSKALEIKKLKQKLVDIPEIREERVKQLKESIKKGEYHVDSMLIARKILNEIEQE